MIKSVTIKNNDSYGDVTVEVRDDSGERILICCENGASLEVDRNDIMDAIRALRPSYYNYRSYGSTNNEESED